MGVVDMNRATQKAESWFDRIEAVDYVILIGVFILVVTALIIITCNLTQMN